MLKLKKQLNFVGCKFYIGIDVHKKQFTVTIQLDQVVLKTFSMLPDPKILVNYLHKHYPGGEYYAAYEAGFSGFWLQEQLEELGVNCIVVNPSDIPTTNKEKNQKRDPLDSKKIARSLKNGDLVPLHIPSKQNQYDRSLVRTRDRLVRDQTRCRNRIKSFLAFYGIEYPERFTKSGSHWSNLFMEWLKSIKLGDEGTIALNLFIKEAEALRELILEANREIRKLSRKERYDENVRLLLSIPGVGILTAMSLLTELEDIKRFKSLDHLCSYVGLVPNVHASGDNEKVGDITHRGNRQLRHMLVESSWVAIRQDPALTLKYKDLNSKMNGNKAIIRIARKLLNRIKHVLVNKEEYVFAVA